MHPRLLPFSVVCLLAGVAGMRAAEGEFEVKLTGITYFNERSQALLEITGPAPRTLTIRPILAEGERIGTVEVRKIDAQAGLVQIANNGIETTFPIDGRASEVKRTFNLKDADLVQVLEIYQQLSGRTVLRSSGMPGMKFSLKTDDLAKADAERFLEEALLAKGIVIELRAGKFALAVRTGQVERLASVPEPPAAPAPKQAQPPVKPPPVKRDIFPPGLIKFQDTDLPQVIEIHQELTGRTVLRPSDLGGAKITLRTQTEMTRQEAIWVIEAALALAEVTTVLKGEKFAFVVRTAQVDRLAFIADPPTVAASVNEDVIPAGQIKFLNGDVLQALDIYQELTGRTVIRPSALHGAKITVRTQTPLTRPEVVWAMQALFGLADIATVPQGEKLVLVLPGIENPMPPLIVPAPEQMPAGELRLLKLQEASLGTVLQLYADLIGRDPLPVDPPTPAVKLTLRTQTQVTPREAVFALNALAAVNNVEFVLVGDDQVKILPAPLARINPRPGAASPQRKEPL